MAQAYSRVLDDLSVDHQVIGRGTGSATAFESATGHAVRPGGVERAIGDSSVPDTAIVAVSVDQLAQTASQLLRAGVRRILLEKPAGLSCDEVRPVRADASNGAVVVAYNRRHYASVRAARAAIAEDGGVCSFSFEVTEWPHATEPTQVGPTIRRRWFIAQTSHVVDLAFHLGGRPANWTCHSAGSLTWHPESARYSGAGTTIAGATFGYHGDWEAPGRWAVEILTRHRRLILRPLEELRSIPMGSHEVEIVTLDDDLDRTFKPGVHRQATAFLDGDDSVACLLDEHMANMEIFERMAGYR